MNLITLLHKFARVVCFPLLLILPLGVVTAILGAVIPVIGTEDPPNAILVTLAWTLILVLLILGALFFLNAFLVYISFKREVSKLTMQGKPVRGIEGFQMVNGRLTYFLISSLIIFLLILSSFLGYSIQMVGALGNFLSSEQAQILGLILLILAAGLVFMSIGITLLIEMPYRPAFEAGGLLNLYKPSYIPMVLDNLLSDAMFSILDPATRIYYDEWTESIKAGLHPNFETEADTLLTRVERAREKIILLTYFRDLMPNALTQEIFEAELKEVIREEVYNDFMAGKASGISINILKQIIRRLKALSPEIFTLVDQITMEIIENPYTVSQSDIWTAMGGPSVHFGTLFPFRVLGFVLNRSPEFATKRRPIEIKVTSGRHSIDPDNFVCYRELDEADDMEFPSEKLPFASREGTDILDLVTRTLQVGDAFWFQFKPNRFGFHPINLEIYEGEHQVAAKSLAVWVKIDIRYLLKSYGGRVGALLGAAIPIIAGALGIAL